MSDPDNTRKRRLPHINFRPLLFCAFGFLFGIFLYFRIAFGGFTISDLLFSGAVVVLALFPLSWKRTAVIAACFLLFSGLGATCAHLYKCYSLTGKDSGEYTVEGTVSEFTPIGNYTQVVLSSLSLDGERVQGKLTGTTVEDLRPGDVIRFTGTVERIEFPDGEDTAYSFTENIRYTAELGTAEHLGKSGNFLLRINAGIYGTLEKNAGRDECALCYAILTGNSGSLDESLRGAAQKGGIAHIFAVSGLHIGIFYGAVAFLCRPFKRYAFLPAALFAFLYAGICGFSVSALRAVIMCFVHALTRFFRRKTDFLNTLSVAAIVVLFFFPAQWLAAGFRLSFGACFGIALFSNPISRGLKRIHIPSSLAGGIASSCSVQLFVFPILLENFGYVSFWGLLLNLFLVPFLPLIFLTLLVPVLFALVIPPAGAVVKVANATASLLIYLLAAADLSFVLTGFSLGAGSVLWGTGCVFLSDRFRMPRMVRLGASCIACILLAIILVLNNLVLTGCKISVADKAGRTAVLVQTKEASVLIIDDTVRLSDCNLLLAKSYGGTLDAVIVVGEDIAGGINVAAFLKTKKICALYETETGLRERVLEFGDTFEFSGLKFRFEGESRLVLFAEGCVTEFAFGETPVLSADLTIERGNGNLKYFLQNGTYRERGLL